MENSSPPGVISPSNFRAIPSRKRVILLTLFLLIVAGGVGAAGLFYINTVVKFPTASRSPGGTKTPGRNEPGERCFYDLERMNILVLGIDNNYDQRGQPFTKGARSDSVMVVSLDRHAKFLNILSIPRDTQVLISESLGYEKINAAYAFGGPRQAMRTVERFLHVPIHHYVVVKIAGAKKVIDALGGLPIDVEKDMDYDDNWGHLHVHLKKGPQVLMGEQAVGYARFRKDAEGDRGRMRRQQQVIKVMADLLKSSKIVTRFPKLAKAVKSTLETDFELGQMIDLAELYRKFDKKEVHTGQIEGEDAMVGGVSMIIPDGPKTDKVVRALLKDDADLALRDMHLLVLNGSGEVGAGQRLADHLTAQGLHVVKVDSAKRSNYAATEIIENIKNPRMHGLLAHFCVGAAFSEGTATPGQDYDVIIILGRDKTLEFVRTAPAPPPPPTPDRVVSRPLPDRSPVSRPTPGETRTESPNPEAIPGPPPLTQDTPSPPPVAPARTEIPSPPPVAPPIRHIEPTREPTREPSRPEPVLPPATPAVPQEKPTPMEAPRATPLAPEG